MESTISTAATEKIMIETTSWRDLNAIRQLESLCFPKDAWPLWDIIGVLTLPNVIRLKAVNDGRLVGFIAAEVRKAEHTTWIATIGVLPSYRRRGTGTALLQMCEAQIKTPAVRLCVRRSNQAAIRLYERLDYHHVSVWTNYYQDGEDALVLEKQLQPAGGRRDRL